MRNIAAAAHTSKRLMDTWFRGFVPGRPLSPNLLGFWYGGSKEIDDMLCDQFKNDAERALVNREFRERMKSTQEGTLALTLLLDQVPRNIFRGTSRPFVEFDPLARETVKEALAKNTCGQMHPVFRHFLYMPLEHSENHEDQAACVKEFTKEYEKVEPMYKEMFKSALEYAKAHEAVIEKFGRFPHRNDVLGRVHTEAERIHLETGGDRW
ncbi:hypothetical protein BGZ65_004909 [Modicella reniformis]|uniref:DUF924-domain-containing protein n=1 Tax=Modicella reniformis TaxID=1440133 RepID=A0A9P6J681_9FUNG|nr:hypothetical protein BGZ65_004909 [Modicella reniformis]